jgi:hypothetical protein
MGVQSEIIIPRYVVLTRLADSWIPRASHGDVEAAEAEAFRWRRIYGPGRTKVAEYLVPEPVRNTLPAVIPAIIDVPSFTVREAPFPHSSAMAGALAPGSWQAQLMGLQDAALKALVLYLGFGFANRVMELLIALARH